MANTRKTTTKTTAEKKTTSTAEEKVETVSKAVTAPRKFDMDEYINCLSLVYGPLYVKGPKTQIIYQWTDYGDITPVMYGDLLSLYSMKDKSIIKPRIKILDEDLVQQWGKVLADMYNNMQEADIEEILAKSPKAMRSAIENAPDGVKVAIKTIAAKKIQDGELDSLNKIKILDEVLGTDLRLLTE